MNAIQFGTSGHRGILGEGFTARHVQAIAHAIGCYVSERCTAPSLILGMDPREGNSPTLKPGSWSELLTQTLLSWGVNVWLHTVFAPTPLISWAIGHYGLQGGIMLTASHNPPAYNGLKFNDAWGAPAPVDVTQQIETLANRFFTAPPAPGKAGDVRQVNLVPGFSKTLIESVRHAQGGEAVSVSGKKVVVDVKHGTAASVWEALFSGLRIRDYDILHAEPRSDFGNRETNPTAPGALVDLVQRMREMNADMGFAHDPDADRHVIVDENGDILLPEETATLILHDLIRSEMPVAGITTTVASSVLVRFAARHWQVGFTETPVGFKYFAPFLKEARLGNRIGLAVESSGGFSASFHTLEKCGFLPCLWVLKIAADRQMHVSELRAEIHRELGKWIFQEKAVHFNADKKGALADFFVSVTETELADALRCPVIAIDRRDGLKLWVSDAAWILWRISGTEPVARLYVEAPTAQEAIRLQRVGETLIKKVVS